ncbi:MAG: hypothetical protein M3Y31_08905 [Gemmatimonadota bacterium]|nr:hypothetical protein [Gemmatimonadota bacterium]
MISRAESRITGVLRLSLAIGGAGLAGLGVLAIVTAVEGADGPTRLLGVLGRIWEMTFTAALIPILGALSLVCMVVRALSAWVTAALTALALCAAASIAILRIAGWVDVSLPLANWLPGTILMAIWGWVAARAAVREGYLVPPASRAAGALLIAQIALLALACGVVLVAGTDSPAVNISAGAASGGMWITVGVMWFAGAARWGKRGCA